MQKKERLPEDNIEEFLEKFKDSRPPAPTTPDDITFPHPFDEIPFYTPPLRPPVPDHNKPLTWTRTGSPPDPKLYKACKEYTIWYETFIKNPDKNMDYILKKAEDEVKKCLK